MDCSTPGLPVLHHLPEFAQTHGHWVGDAIQPSVVLFSCLQSFPASGSFPMSQFFTRWAKYWSFSFSISPSNEYLGLIYFRIDCFDLIAVHGTLKSLLQHHSSKASILQRKRSAFFMVQLSHPYMTTGKILALTRWTFVGKVMSLFFNMLSRFVTAVLPRSMCLWILKLQSLSSVSLELKKIKSVTVFMFSPSICQELMGLDVMILVFWMLSFKFILAY